MGMRTLTVELPEELVAALGPPEAAASRVREALVAQLLRDGAVGESRAAELLGVTRWDILALMDRYGVRHGPRSAEELARDAAGAERAASP